MLVPGKQAVDVISAMPDGFAEEVLRNIAHPKDGYNPMNNPRFFGEWKNGVCFGSVYVNCEEEREFALKLGVKEGLFLKDSEGFGRFSLKHNCDGNGLCTIPVSENVYSKKSRYRSASTVANCVVGSWIIHGKNWQDRAGNLFFWPYGIDEKRKEDYGFLVKDGKGKGSFSDLLGKKVFRSTHVGVWDSPQVVVPAASGVPIILHEFEEGSDKINNFRGKRISSGNDEKIWGPYLKWRSNVLENVNFGEFEIFAKKASNPFNFHVSATKAVFPNCRLSSSFLLSKMGSKKLLSVLKLIAEKDPERFYRLIDEKGVTHKLQKVENGTAFYSGDSGILTFNLSDAPANALSTFMDLAKIEKDSDFDVERKRRVVLDSHFFVVVFAILTAEEGVSHHLSGRYMHKYLTSGGDSVMHRIRNDRLFYLIKEDMDFCEEKLKFVIYPSLPLRLPNLDQYNFDPSVWDQNHWLSKAI